MSIPRTPIWSIPGKHSHETSSQPVKTFSLKLGSWPTWRTSLVLMLSGCSHAVSWVLRDPGAARSVCHWGLGFSFF